MSHEPRRNNRPDFNEVFRHELGPCKAPAKKPKDRHSDLAQGGRSSR